jgi:hypothetical protein
MSEVTLNELRTRAAAAGLTLSDEQVQMMQRLLSDALAPLRRTDSHALRMVEPAVTFDASGRGEHHDAGR